MYCLDVVYLLIYVVMSDLLDVADVYDCIFARFRILLYYCMLLLYYCIMYLLYFVYHRLCISLYYRMMSDLLESAIASPMCV